jgi:hypothetical protein
VSAPQQDPLATGRKGRRSIIAFAPIVLLLALAAPVIAGSVVTDPEPDKPCPADFGSGVVSWYRTTVGDPSDAATWTVSVEFTVEGGTCEISLATYELPSGTFSLPQTLHDSDSGTFGPGTHTLTASLPHVGDMPGCFAQYDFVFGPALQMVDGNASKYGDRQIRARIVGTDSCTAVVSTPTPEGSLAGGTSSPTPESSVQGGTGTPEPSQPDTAMGLDGGGSLPIPTIAFGMILLASLGSLAYVNMKAARARR